jgi:hypothetical protein
MKVPFWISGLDFEQFQKGEAVPMSKEGGDTSRGYPVLIEADIDEIRLVDHYKVPHPPMWVQRILPTDK